MAIRVDKKSLKNIALGEVFKTGISVLVLVCLQVAFNSLGIGGFGLAALLYGIAILLSNRFTVDPDGVEFGPDSVVDEKTRKSSTAYLVRTGVSLGLVIIGLLVWLIVGRIQGVETTFAEVKQPEQVVKQLAGNNVYLKIFYLTISHMTLYSFSRFWMNAYEALYAFFTEITESTKRK